MQVSDNALEIMQERILHEGEEPIHMATRVAKHVAKGDIDLQKEFEDIIHHKYFLPNSPCLVNSGTKMGQLSACFVLPVEDSMESIFGSLRDMAIIQKTGGGTGFSFNKLRGKGKLVKSTNGEASGPISFLDVYNQATEAVKQGGRRRGASLAVLNVDHPDIEEFIEAKKDEKRLNNFNVSVGVTDEFMARVQEGDKKATKIWNKIAECAWATGEPGVLFLDEINIHNPTPELGKIEACNPCGEATLLPYESCVLGSVNLAEMVEKARIDYDLLASTVRTAVRFLDNVIDANYYPLPEIEQATRRTRKIGLGIMGLADMFFQMGIRYGNEESLSHAERVMEFVNEIAVEESEKLAVEKGAYSEKLNRRNAVVTSIAPTGTLSTIAGCTSGIEPAFALAYKRNISIGEFYETNQVFQDTLKEEKIDSNVLEKINQNRGSCQGIEEIPKHIQNVFVTAHELTWKEHVDMQAVLQKHVEQSISKTINFHESSTVEDIKEAYQYAWERGCKGITIYRDGSRQQQVLSTKHTPTERPHVLYGETRKFSTGCGSLYVTANQDNEGDVHEVFANHSKSSGCVNAFLNALTRVTSISLRSGVDPQSLSKAMSGHVCGECQNISSCADAVSSLLMPQVCSLDGGCQTCD